MRSSICVDWAQRWEKALLTMQFAPASVARRKFSLCRHILYIKSFWVASAGLQEKEPINVPLSQSLNLHVIWNVSLRMCSWTKHFFFPFDPHHLFVCWILGYNLFSQGAFLELFIELVELLAEVWFRRSRSDPLFRHLTTPEILVASKQVLPTPLN